MNAFEKTTFFVLAVISISIVNGAPLIDNSDETTIPGLANCPRIVTREEWRARKNSSPYSPMVVSPMPYVVAHHGGIPHYCYDQETCSRIVRGYQNFHMDTHKWIDIGYHFLIGGDGNVYEGRGWDHVGAHAPGYNGQGVGICIIGDYTSHMPNEASLTAFESLIECGVSIGKVRPDYKLIGHRQGRSTECPGQTFFEYLKTMSHFEEHPTPLHGTSIVTVQNKPVKTPVPTVDITGTKLWTDLIALGVSATTVSTLSSSPDGGVEENVVDTGNAAVKAPAISRK